MHTPTAAALAAGSVIDLVHRVAAGSLRSVNLETLRNIFLALLDKFVTVIDSYNGNVNVCPFRNGLGLVRPPGHHAERAMVRS